MSLAEIGIVAEIVSALAVLVTLIYLARQVRHANLLARAQTRQRMIEQGNEELYVLMNDPQLRECMARKTPLSREQQGKLHFFLTSAMRAREWEWFQERDKLVRGDAHNAYQEVIGLHLGMAHTRKWWETVGRVGFDPVFVAEVDAFIEDRPIHSWFEDILIYDEEPDVALSSHVKSD